MDIFIVRIYRRATQSGREPAGTVQRVGADDRIGFASREQLLDYLLAGIDSRRSTSAPAGDEGTPDGHG